MQKRNLIIWGVIILMFMVMMTMTQNGANMTRTNEISYTEMLDRVESGDVTKVTDKGDELIVTLRNGETVTTQPARNHDDFVSILVNNDVVLENDRESGGGSMAFALLINLLPFILLIGIWIFFMRNMQNNGKSAMGFGKSKAKMLTEQHGRRTFDDVAGVEEAKEDLQEVVEFLKDPTKFQRLGGKIPAGALLVGPPGTGKTLLARAVAGEAGVPFFTISGSDFVEMFVGVGASRVRDMFEQAKKNAPCIIFIDEIDAVGRHRGVGTSGGHEEREQTLNQLLVEMDGFEGNEGVIILAATNRPDVLDKALLRPGRFDRQINVPLPDIEGREAILKVHMRDVPIAGDVDPRVIARGTPGFSGADLANLVNEAALMAARRNKRKVAHREFEDAKDKVLMGPERKSMVMTDDEKELTAYHEAGHAIVALNVPKTDPVHKATIIPRGRALGMVMQLPERDQYSMSKAQMTSRLAILMGGRVAEEIRFGDDNVTSGASSDIEMATRMSRAMVTEYGLSDKIGPIAYKNTDNDSFVPGIGRGSSISAETARMIEDEIKRFVTDGYDEARRILTEKKADWEKLAETLLEYETLSGDEIKALLDDGTLPKRPGKDGPKKPSISAVPPTGKRRPDTGGAEPVPGT